MDFYYENTDPITITKASKEEEEKKNKEEEEKKRKEREIKKAKLNKIKLLKIRIEKLSKIEFIEIYKIIKSNDEKYSQNNTSILFDLMKLSESTTEKIENFLNYIENNNILIQENEKTKSLLI